MKKGDCIILRSRHETDPNAFENYSNKFIFQENGEFANYQWDITTTRQDNGGERTLSNTKGKGVLLRFQEDNNFVMYDANNKVVWSTHTDRGHFDKDNYKLVFTSSFYFDRYSLREIHRVWSGIGTDDTGWQGLYTSFIKFI